MVEFSLENPWIFTVLVIIVWVLLWGTLELFFFDVDLIGAVITGLLTGLVFGLFYIAVSSQMDE